MIFLVYSSTRKEEIVSSLGEPEYSYYFVLREYLPVLEQLGETIIITDPATEVDALYHQYSAKGEQCFFLSFTPPDKTLLELECPTIPIFAWEFSNIPNEVWEDNISTDWRFVLGMTGWAITHSTHTVKNIQAHLRKDYPIISAPAPVWDRWNQLLNEHGDKKPVNHYSLTIESGCVVDTRHTDLSLYAPDKRAEAPQPIPIDSPVSLELDGVIYTTILNPIDGRKNWMDMIWTFCWALRDHEDATLILKLTHHNTTEALDTLLYDLYKSTPFKCRVIAIDGYLSEDNYANLAINSSYTVNSSRGEGQCLPLMEYMSAGAPAIAPKHTGMIDYINEDNTFLVDHSLEPSFWPQDPRQSYRTLRYRIDWESVVEAYKTSYMVAKDDPKKYMRMSEASTSSLEKHCSAAVIQSKLKNFFEAYETTAKMFTVS